MRQKSIILFRRMRRFFLLSFCSLFVFSTSYAYEKPDRGWFFYQNPPKKEKTVVKKTPPPPPPKPKPQPKPKPKPLPKPKPKKEKKKGFVFPVRPGTPEPIKEFLLHPNIKTAERFLAWQYQYFQHLEKIGYTLREAYLADGPQVYPIQGYPGSQLASVLYFNDYRRNLLSDIFQKLRHRFGLIIFYGGSCPMCRQELPIVLGLEQMYHIPMRAVNVDGNMLNLPIKQVYNPRLAQMYGITRIPTVVAVLQKRDGEVKQAIISVGLTAADTMVSMITQFLRLEGEIKGSDLNFKFSKHVVNEVR